MIEAYPGKMTVKREQMTFPSEQISECHLMQFYIYRIPNVSV